MDGIIDRTERPDAPVIGVLALQGAVEPHRAHVEAAGGRFLPVRTPDDFQKADAFILPGGESTTMLKLIDDFGLEAPLARQFAAKPVWGVCAGAILMARTIQGRAQKSFGLLDMTVSRNAYGRQLQSIQMEIADYPVSFIRAPVIDSVGEGVEVLAERAGKPVWVRQGGHMASTFHPELTRKFPSPLHRMLVRAALHRMQVVPAGGVAPSEAGLP
jgi:5'-phosphate synthase pdxT subunit